MKPRLVATNAAANLAANAIPGEDDAPALAPAPAPGSATDDAAAILAGFTPVATRTRRDGWTAERQRTFLTSLAETGSISQSCVHAGVSSRSAYRLRARPDGRAFAAAWDQALGLATTRLLALAFERATRGTVREYYREGELTASVRAPSDRLLMFLLRHLLPSGDRWREVTAASEEVRDRFGTALAALTDNPVEMVPIAVTDFYDTAPGFADDES